MKTKTSYWLAVLAVSLGIAVRVHAASTIQFTPASYTVAENAGAVTLIVQRVGDTNSAVTVDFATVDGTATKGSKYAPVSGPLAFGAGETTKLIVVPILNEGLVEGSKTFQVILSNPTGGAVLAPPTHAIVAITDNDFGIQFQFPTNSVSEDAGTVVFDIVRGDDGALPVTVDFFTRDLTARSGLDYTGITNTLSFAAQERRRQVSVPILNNTLKQPNRIFGATLANPAGVTLGSQKTATATIMDNDQGFQFEFASYSLAEDAAVALITVLRGTDDTNSTVTVDYITIDSSAKKGVDYLAVTNTLSFAPGERVKLVSVPIVNDGVKEPTKNFRVTLGNSTGGAVLGRPTSANVTIVDNDPGVSFEMSSYPVEETAGVVILTVLRGNDFALGPIAADYATSNLTATAGQDYQAVSGTLVFNENETVKTITVPVLRRGSGSNDSSFKVTLSQPTGGAALGTASTIVNILNAAQSGTYQTVAPPFDTALTIRDEEGFNLLAWNGAGQLQRADRPDGPWQTLAAATSPYTVQSPVPATFYRVTLPRPVRVYIPSSYHGQTPAPLVILLHGYTFTGDDQESYLHFRPLAEARGFLYCHPDGLLDQAGLPFWNATDGCCDFFNTGTDDAGYLLSLIEEISRRFVVDRKRVYLVGHSNGGFMAYRMACQSADLIAGIASLAGTTFLDRSRCGPSQPVNILHIHGTGDGIIPYGGGAKTIDPLFPANMPSFPGALQTIQFWAGYNGARDPVTDAAPSMDLDLDVPGLDAVITRYTNHPPGGAVELWTINGGNHGPTLSPEFSSRVIDWLLAHPKP